MSNTQREPHTAESVLRRLVDYREKMRPTMTLDGSELSRIIDEAEECLRALAALPRIEADHPAYRITIKETVASMAGEKSVRIYAICSVAPAGDTGIFFLDELTAHAVCSEMNAAYLNGFIDSRLDESVR